MRGECEECALSSVTARQVWDYWGDFIEPIAARVPWMVGIGNHEYDYDGQPFEPDWGNYGNDSHGECGVAFMARYHMPAPAIGARAAARNLWFSYDLGYIHFLVFSSVRCALLPRGVIIRCCVRAYRSTTLRTVRICGSTSVLTWPPSIAIERRG